MRRFCFAAVAALAIVCPLNAQSTAPAAPAIDFSGLMFGSFNVRTDSAARASLGGKTPTQFGVDRVYLNFRMPAGDNGSIRVTSDIFQNTSTTTNGYYQGWTVRMKYAYFQYTGGRGKLGEGSSVAGRVGMIQTLLFDQAEVLWPRFLHQSPVERAGFFSSADIGVAGIVTLPRRYGELYATVTNGGGYQTYDRDRFKDYGIRATFTPFAGSTSTNPWIKSFMVVPWYYKGATGSSFAAGGAGQVGPGDNGAITEGLTRNRYGIFAGARDRRLSVGVDFAERQDESEAGANTTIAPRVMSDSTGRLIDAYIVARPLEWLNSARRSPLSLVARLDHLTPNVDPTSPNYAGTTPSYDFTLFGAMYDVNQRITLALDWQQITPKGFPPATGANVRPIPKQSTVFLHWQATF